MYHFLANFCLWIEYGIANRNFTKKMVLGYLRDCICVWFGKSAAHSLFEIEWMFSSISDQPIPFWSVLTVPLTRRLRYSFPFGKFIQYPQAFSIAIFYVSVKTFNYHFFFFFGLKEHFALGLTSQWLVDTRREIKTIFIDLTPF